MSKAEPMCLLEKIIQKAGFELVHDGQKNPGQFELPAKEIARFTRKYRWKIDGQFVNTWVTFMYDKREQLADVEFYTKDPALKGREKMLLNLPSEETGYEVR